MVIMNLDDFLNEARKMGYEDFKYSSQEIEGGRLETFFLGMPENAPKLPQEKSSVPESILLPPKEQFIFDLRYLLDLAKATKVERATMEGLIKRFENEDSNKRRTPRKTL